MEHGQSQQLRRRASEDHLSEITREAETLQRRWAAGRAARPGDFVVLTSRSRNLGYSWTTRPVRSFSPSGRDYLGIAEPGVPAEYGGPATVERGIREHRRFTQGGEYSRGDVFVAGRRVVAIEGAIGSDGAGDLVRRLREGERVVVELGRR